MGADENAPIELVVVALDQETGWSSALFILDAHGMGRVEVAGGYPAAYRQENGPYLDENVISVSMDVEISDGSYEIHDYDLSVTQEEEQGKYHTVYTAEETIEQDSHS